MKGTGTRRRVQSDMLNVRLPQALKREIERRSQAQGLKVSEAMRHTLQAQAVGCLDWQRDGLGSPPAVQEATEAYRLEQDRLGQFLADCTVPAPRARSAPPTSTAPTNAGAGIAAISPCRARPLAGRWPSGVNANRRSWSRPRFQGTKKAWHRPRPLAEATGIGSADRNTLVIREVSQTWM